MNESGHKLDVVRLLSALSPIVLFFLLFPFMNDKIPYHADLSGNIDANGSKWILFGFCLVSSILIFYVYKRFNLKRLTFSAGLVILLVSNALFLLGSVVTSSNLYSGFLNHLGRTFANQMSFVMFILYMLFFLFYKKIKPLFWFGMMLNLYVFMVPDLNDFTKLSITFMTVILTIAIICNRVLKKKRGEHD